jgi:hypothetical protein
MPPNSMHWSFADIHLYLPIAEDPARSMTSPLSYFIYRGDKLGDRVVQTDLQECWPVHVLDPDPHVCSGSHRTFNFIPTKFMACPRLAQIQASCSDWLNVCGTCFYEHTTPHKVGNPICLVMLCLISVRRDKVCPLYRVRNWNNTNRLFLIWHAKRAMLVTP